MIKKILFWIILINFFGTFPIALSDIIPLKKPIQSEELTQKKLLIDVLKPLPKPIPTKPFPSPMTTKAENLNLLPLDVTFAVLLILMTDSSLRSSSPGLIIAKFISL